MKEQWKKQDSDAKLLQNVEEGRPQPIKIELPISAFGLKQNTCCNRLIIFLRLTVLFVLLAILSCTGATLYAKYYPQFIVIDENSERLVSNQLEYRKELVNNGHNYNEENKLSFRNKVYAILNEQDIASNEIDSFTATTSEIIEMKNLIPENRIQNEQRLYLLNKDGTFMTNPQVHVKLVNSPLDMHQNDYFAEKFHLQDEVEPKSDTSSNDLEANIKVLASPDKELDSDKGSMEVLKNVYESVGESQSNEVVVIPTLKDEDIHQTDQDLENYIELGEIDDIEELINGIANVMGLIEEPSSEVDQLLGESVAVIQEEIKSNEEKLGIDDIDKVSSTEEKSKEQSVAVIQEEIKNDDEGVPNIYLVDLEPISEEQERYTEDEEKSQETWPSSQIWSTEDKSREILSSSETMNSPQSPFNPDHTENSAVIIAKLLEPFVGNDYNLVHWYYNVFEDPLGMNKIADADLIDINDRRKVFAAKILYNQNITEYDADMQMWLNEISKDSFSSDLINSQQQVEADTLLQKQIVEKLLWKLFLKKQYDLNMMTFKEVWEILDQSNSNHVKCWFLATHPLIRNQDLISYILKSMEYRRKIFPDIKSISSAVRFLLTNEDIELKLLSFDYDDFREEPVPTLNEQRLLVNYVDTDKLFKQETGDKTAEISEETKLSGDYLPASENESKDNEDQFKQIQQLIIEFNAQLKEFGKDYDYAEVDDFLKHTKLIEAMKKVGEEYKQIEQSAEETTISLNMNDDEIKESEEETAASTTENDDIKEEISSYSDQSESLNTNLNPTVEFENDYNKQTIEDPSEELGELETDAEAFLKWLVQHDITMKPEENEEADYDPFDY